MWFMNWILTQHKLNAHCIYMGLPRSWGEKFAPTVFFGVKHLYDSKNKNDTKNKY